MSEPERRAVNLDEAKFFTQKAVTFGLLTIFAGVVVAVMIGTDQAERSTILQTVINLTILAVGYWLGSSKGAADASETVGKIAKAAPLPPAPEPQPAAQPEKGNTP